MDDICYFVEDISRRPQSDAFSLFGFPFPSESKQHLVPETKLRSSLLDLIFFRKSLLDLQHTSQHIRTHQFHNLEVIRSMF
ncbi:hypothetical protein L2E82_13711 [Cichorium intybus]|uniref:Uncharacterized protein n=1 Tax=Cichorium intybus TaxID=13427 RepID=A0ACB9EYC8_CICIN|nr:hypothetical protein L2E82_13711 [Cichorium intybus]